ncbi:MAG TPA: ATP-binding protein [bacterium]|nr:ATP-binding protein [bacterium]
MQQDMTLRAVESVLGNLGYGTIALNDAGVVVSVSRSAADILHMKQGQILGKEYGILGESFFQVIQCALSRRVSASQDDIVYTTPDGMKRFLSCTLCDIPGGDGSRAVGLFVRDDTDLVERECAAERTQRLARIGAMTASIAHDIKNPLVALKTFAELFPQKYHDRDFRETFTSIVQNEIRRIDDMVSRLLDYANPKKPRLETVRLDTMITETLSLYSLRVTEQRIDIRKGSGLSTAPHLQGDGGQLRRVFNNLILNGIEAMPNGGTLSIDAAVKSGKDRKNGIMVRHIEILVADTGEGISGRDAEKIFEPFYTTKKNGSGLGLSICKKIIEEHGGTIQVSSGGGGTCFTVRFPLPDAAFVKSVRPGPKGVANSSGELPLGIEDAPWLTGKAVNR